MKVCIVHITNYSTKTADVAGMFFIPEHVTNEEIQNRASIAIDNYISIKESALNLTAEEVKKDLIPTITIMLNQDTSVYINELVNVARQERNPEYKRLPSELKEVLDQFFDRKPEEGKPNEE
jgi:hypothetical protein